MYIDLFVLIYQTVICLIVTSEHIWLVRLPILNDVINLIILILSCYTMCKWTHYHNDMLVLPYNTKMAIRNIQ